MGIESSIGCIGRVEITEKHGSRVDVGTVSGVEKQFER
jgi:hypothetical protein